MTVIIQKIMPSLFRKKRRKSWQRSRIRNNRFSPKRRNELARILKIVVVAGAVFFVVYFLFFSQFFLIKEIKVSGNKSISSENIENVARMEVSDAMFGFIPGNNFLFNKNEMVKSALTEEFSEIKSIEVKRIFPNALEIKMIEKEPTIIWCRFDDCYYIDNGGVVFTRADNDLKMDADKRIIKIIEERIIKEEELAEEKELAEKLVVEKEEVIAVADISLTGEEELEEIDSDSKASEEEDVEEEILLSPIEINDKVSDSDFINFALNIDREIKRNTQLKIKFYKTKGTKTRELIAYTDKNIRLYFNTMENADLQAEYLKNFLLKGVGKDRIDSLEYIYFESGNKIFYK